MTTATLNGMSATTADIRLLLAIGLDGEHLDVGALMRRWPEVLNFWLPRLANDELAHLGRLVADETRLRGAERRPRGGRGGRC